MNLFEIMQESFPKSHLSVNSSKHSQDSNRMCACFLNRIGDFLTCLWGFGDLGFFCLVWDFLSEVREKGLLLVYG